MGFFAGLSGRDRLALSRYLREQGAEVSAVGSMSQLVADIENGTFAGGIVESLSGAEAVGQKGWDIAWLPDELGRDPIALGLWKGDLTLKREIVSVLDDMREDGTLEELTARYGAATITQTLGEPQV